MRFPGAACSLADWSTSGVTLVAGLAGAASGLLLTWARVRKDRPLRERDPAAPPIANETGGTPDGRSVTPLLP